MRRLGTGILLLALAALLPGPAHARVNSTLCTKVWNACASIQNVEFSGNQLKFEVSNISSAPGTGSSYIRKMLLRFKDPVSITAINVQGSNGSWSYGKQTGKVGGLKWDVFVQGQGGKTGIYVGKTATFTITFKDNESSNSLLGAAYKFQSLGFDKADSEWAIAPEPITLVLLGTGLAGIGGISALRRRRRDSELIDS